MPKWKLYSTPTGIYFKDENGNNITISCEFKESLLLVYENEEKTYKKEYLIKSTTKKPGVYMSGKEILK